MLNLKLLSYLIRMVRSVILNIVIEAVVRYLVNITNSLGNDGLIICVWR